MGNAWHRRRLPLVAVWLTLLLAPTAASFAQTRAYRLEGDALAVLDPQAAVVIDRIPLLHGASDVAISADGRRAYVAGSGRLQVVDLTEPAIRAVTAVVGDSPPDDRVRLSPRGDRIYLWDLANDDRDACILEYDTSGALHASICLPVGARRPGYLFDFAVGSDGQRAVAVLSHGGGNDGLLGVYDIDLTSAAVVHETLLDPRGMAYSAAAVTSDLTSVYLSTAQAVLAVDPVTGQTRARIDMPGFVQLTWDEPSQRLFGWSAEQRDGQTFTRLYEFDVAQGLARPLARLDGWPHDVRLTPDGAAFFLSLSEAGLRTLVIDADSGAELATIAATAEPGRQAFAPRPLDAQPVPTSRPSPTPALPQFYRAMIFSRAAQTYTVITTGAADVPLSTRASFGDASAIVSSPDGQALYATASSEFLQIDPGSGAVVDRIALELNDGEGPIAVAPDGHLVWIYSYPQLWSIDLSTRTTRSSIPALNGDIAGLAFAPDGSRLYAISGEQYNERRAGWLASIDPVSRQVLQTVALPGAAVDLAISSDGRRAYVALEDSLAVVDTVSMALAAVVPLPLLPQTTALSPDGATLYLAGRVSWSSPTPQLVAVDTAALRAGAPLALGEREQVRRLRLTPDGQRAVVAITGAPSRAVTVDLSRFAVIAAPPVGADPTGLVIAPNASAPLPTPTVRPHRVPTMQNPCMLIPHSAGPEAAAGTITLVDPHRHGVVRALRVGEAGRDYLGNPVFDGVSALAVGPDGVAIYAVVHPYSGGAGYVAEVDPAGAVSADRLYVGLQPSSIALTADGQFAAVLNTNYYDGQGPTVSIIDLRIWRVVDEVALPDAYAGPFLSADGRYFLFRSRTRGSDDQHFVERLTVTDPLTARVEFEIPLPTSSAVGGLAVLPDANRILIDTTAEYRQPDIVSVVDLAEQAVTSRIEVPRVAYEVRGWGTSTFAVSRDGHSVYRTSGSKPGAVTVIDPDAGAVVAQIPFDRPLYAPAFTPDGAFVYTSGSDYDETTTDSALSYVAVIDVAARRIVTTIDVGGDPGGAVAARIDAACTSPFDPSPTFTPLGSPTATAPGAPTATPSVRPTPTWSGRPVELQLGSGSGAAGERVPIALRLRDGGAAVAGTSVEIEFVWPLRVAADADGRPSCRADASSGKTTGFAFWPPGCAGEVCETARAITLSFTDLDPIPDDTVLFTCDVAIAAEATPGDYPLSLNAAEASDADGNWLITQKQSGTVSVVTQGGESLHGSDATSSGCAIGPPAPVDAAWLLAPLFLLMLRRRRE